MKKIFKNRTAIGVGSILLALLLCFGVTPLVNKSMRKQTEIVRASKDIRKGEKITKDKIMKVKVGAYNLPQNIIKDPKEVIGSYANTDIYKDDYFLNTKISKKSNGDSYLMDREDSMSISVTIKNLAAGLSGKLKAGDIVSIISSGENDIAPAIIPELQYVEVLSVSTKEGRDAEGEKDELPSTITLRVNSIQAEKIVEHEQNGDIHFALVYRGSEGKAKKYLKIQEQYIEGLEMEGEEEEYEEGDIERKNNEEEIIDTKVEDSEDNEEGKEEIQ